MSIVPPSIPPQANDSDILMNQTPDRIICEYNRSMSVPAHGPFRYMSVLVIFLLSIGIDHVSALGEVHPDDPHRETPSNQADEILPPKTIRRNLRRPRGKNRGAGC